MTKTALVIGATGLVGSHLVKLLLKNETFSKVVVFSRKDISLTDRKLEQHTIDFDRPEAWQQIVIGDVLFSALGTTRAKSGSKVAQYKVDYTYQHRFAQIAVANGVKTYVLVSSAGANPKSPSFYMGMKGQLEQAIMRLPFESICIIRPGALSGERSEPRRTEELGVKIISAVNRLGLLLKYRPIHGETVAQAMIVAASGYQPGTRIHALDEIFEMASRYESQPELS